MGGQFGAGMGIRITASAKNWGCCCIGVGLLGPGEVSARFIGSWILSFGEQNKAMKNFDIRPNRRSTLKYRVIRGAMYNRHFA